MKIEVTEQDIKSGKPGKCLVCPIALALVRATGTQWQVHHTYYGLIAELKKKPYTRIILPKKADTFVKRFDDGQKVRPFSFNLRGYTKPART